MKNGLRREMRARRRAFVASLSADALAQATSAIAGAVLDRLGGASIVAAYVAVNGEVDPLPIIAAARTRGLATALPVVESRAAPMHFRRWEPGEPLVDGPLGLRQPSPDAPVAHPDLILAPLVAFDAALGRLGQGASHYDRAFAALPAARRVGLAWSVQRSDEPLPADPWDVPLHAVATERGWLGA